MTARARSTARPQRWDRCNANFAELPFRNCLENRNRSRIGTPKVAKSGQRDPDQPLPAADEARPRGPRLFSKQFRKGYSPKFTSGLTDSLPIHPVFIATG